MNAPGIMQKKAVRRAMYYAAVFLIIILALWLRTYQLQLSHFRNAENYFAKSNFKLAMREYDAAMHMFTPFSPLVDKSAQRLWQIGEAYEKMERPYWALIAYSTLRSSFFASQNIYLPGKKWIRRCEKKITAINVKILTRTGALDPAGAEKEKNTFLQFYRLGGAPDIIWSLMACFGILGWIASVVFLCMGVFGPDGKLRVKQAAYGSLSFIASFAVWVIALLTA